MACPSKPRSPGRNSTVAIRLALLKRAALLGLGTTKEGRLETMRSLLIEGPLEQSHLCSLLGALDRKACWDVCEPHPRLHLIDILRSTRADQYRTWSFGD
jgi:hypothetical protein